MFQRGEGGAGIGRDHPLHQCPSPRVQIYSHVTLPCWSCSPQILRAAIPRAFPNHSPTFLVRSKGFLWVGDFCTSRVCWRVLGNASWLVLCGIMKNHICLLYLGLLQKEGKNGRKDKNNLQTEWKRDHWREV